MICTYKFPAQEQLLSSIENKFSQKFKITNNFPGFLAEVNFDKRQFIESNNIDYLKGFVKQYLNREVENQDLFNDISEIVEKATYEKVIKVCLDHEIFKKIAEAFGNRTVTTYKVKSTLCALLSQELTLTDSSEMMKTKYFQELNETILSCSIQPGCF